MWGALGDLSFRLWLTPEELTITEKDTYSEVNIYGSKPSVHFIKKDLRRIPIKLKLFKTEDFDPQEFLEKLKEMKNRKEPEPLIIGDNYIGDFVIEEIKAVYRKTDINGKLISAEVQINLMEV